MKVLVINAGSSSLKYQLLDPETGHLLAKGLCERIGMESSMITLDIYAKVKYNRPDELVRSMNCAFASWDAAQ